METIITLIAIGYAIGFVIIAYFGIVGANEVINYHNKERLIMKQCDLDLIKFIKKYNNNWQWYSNDRMTKK
jgi:hypothetical protein